MVKRNIPRKAQTFEKVEKKNKEAKLIEKAKKKAALYVGEDRVTFCEHCNKPKMPDIIRTGVKEEGFCECGNPTLYREEYCYSIVKRFQEKKEKLLEELTFYKPDPESGAEYLDNEGLTHWWLKARTPKQLLVEFPTFEERSTNNGILEATRQEWVALFPQFSRSCQMCKQIQYYILIKWGLNNTFNSQIVKLLGQNYFGLTETSRVGNVDANTSEEDMERINKFLSSNQKRWNAEWNEAV